MRKQSVLAVLVLAMMVMILIVGVMPAAADAPVPGYGVVKSNAFNFNSAGGWAGWSVPANKVVLSGGFQLTGGPAAASYPGTPGSVWPHYTYGANEYGWVMQAYPGAASPSSYAYAIYAADSLPGYEIFVKTLGFGPTGVGGWSCPAGKVVVGGGFKAQYPVKASYPGTPGTNVAGYVYGPNEYGWVIENSNSPTTNQITYCAICADPMPGYQVIKSSSMSWGDTGWAGWSVPAGKIVLGGGFQSTGPVAASAPGTPGSVWPHYTYGANEYGWVVQDAPDGQGNTGWVYAIAADLIAPPSAELSASATETCLTPVVVDVNLNDMVDLYGYQFKVNYDQTMFTADVRRPTKSSTSSGHAVHPSERSDASTIIVHQVVGMDKAESVLRRDSPVRVSR